MSTAYVRPDSADYLGPGPTFNPADMVLTIGGRMRGVDVSAPFMASVGVEPEDMGDVVDWPHERLGVTRSADACSCGWHPGNHGYAFSCRDHIADMAHAREVHG